jgi:hypothetical protein
MAGAYAAMSPKPTIELSGQPFPVNVPFFLQSLRYFFRSSSSACHRYDARNFSSTIEEPVISLIFFSGRNADRAAPTRDAADR